jgi:kynureninase
VTRQDCLDLDAADVLAPLREQFALPAGVVYLDGNSLGPLPVAAAARVARVVEREWGEGLIRSWNDAGWIELGQRIGDKIARLVGAGPGETIVADSTSANLFKALCAALDLARGRNVVLTDEDNFPTDLYIAQSIADQRGLELRRVPASQIAARVDDSVAVVLLTQVNYRSGRLHAMAPLNRAAHAAGAVTLWDLSHSAGVVPIDLAADDADFAVGCGYKYLNGGPGAPAYLWAHPRHLARMDAEAMRQPLSGWLGHASPFDFSPDYRPAPGVARFLCGTPPVLSLAALECGIDTVLAAEPHGGVAALRRKSIALTDLFMTLVETRCEGQGLALATPRNPAERGSQVSFACEHDAYAVIQALIERGVIGDFRAPDLVRFGFSPLYTRFVDAWDAAVALHDVLAREAWRAPQHQRRAAVT